MPIDFTCLGQNPEMRQRRYDVLSLFVKGATPQETAELLNLPKKQVENDRMFITKQPLHNLPAEMAKDFNLSFYEMKVRELEDKLEELKKDTRSWIGTQELIRKFKADSLKLQGLMNDKVEHSGDITIKYVGDDIDGNTDKVPTITTTEAISQSDNKV